MQWECPFILDLQWLITNLRIESFTLFGVFVARFHIGWQMITVHKQRYRHGTCRIAQSCPHDGMQWLIACFHALKTHHGRCNTARDKVLINRKLRSIVFGKVQIQYLVAVLAREDIHCINSRHFFSAWEILLHLGTCCLITLPTLIILITSSETEIGNNTVTCLFGINIVLDVAIVVHFVICSSTLRINNTKVCFNSPRLGISFNPCFEVSDVGTVSKCVIHELSFAIHLAIKCIFT